MYHVATPDNRDGPEVFGNAAKIWTAYNTETTKEDRSLSQNIREDMNTLLVFAGLFSATVTAFLVESYKNLKPDPHSTERAILAKLSQEQTMTTAPTSSRCTPASTPLRRTLQETSAKRAVHKLCEHFLRDNLGRLFGTPKVSGQVTTILQCSIQMYHVATPDNRDGPEVFGNAAKIWTAYNTETTKEDRSLSQNIREDMNTLLVFVSYAQSNLLISSHSIIRSIPQAGLFSATVTAFLVESYKNLKPDPHSTERAILAKLSQEQTMMVQQQALMTQALIHISRQLANKTSIPYSPNTAPLQ
ncbi:hypothetical protein C0995_014001, partial [Termitomyces sp. Mi166